MDFISAQCDGGVLAIPRPAESPLGPPMRSRQPRQARRWLSSQHLLLCQKEIPGMFGTDAGPPEPWGLFEDNRGWALGCSFPVGADSVVLAWGRQGGWVARLLTPCWALRRMHGRALPQPCDLSVAGMAEGHLAAGGHRDAGSALLKLLINSYNRSQL